MYVCMYCIHKQVATDIQLHFGLGIGISASEADSRQVMSSERGGMSPVDIAAKISGMCMIETMR
jgi:hypothetical protein